MNKYSISDVMAKTGISKRTVHYYIGRGLIPPALHDANGFFYTDEHITKITYVRWLAAKHVSLQGIAYQMQDKTLAQLEADMRTDTPVGDHFNVVKEQKAPAPYLRVDVLPGLEMHMSADVYDGLKYKMDALITYIQKLSKEG